jgi:hypothetical protein
MSRLGVAVGLNKSQNFCRGRPLCLPSVMVLLLSIVEIEQGFQVNPIITASGQTHRSAPTKIRGYLTHIP